MFTKEKKYANGGGRMITEKDLRDIKHLIGEWYFSDDGIKDYSGWDLEKKNKEKQK